jgi:Flp pilus assembly protein TadD
MNQKEQEIDTNNPAVVATNAALVGPGKPALRGRWTIITIVCALLLSLLSVAGIILVTRPRATIDQLLILTVPSGADVTFDGKPLGPSPVKLEGVRIGIHRVSATKDGYQEFQDDPSITDSRTLDYKLKLLPPPGAEDLPEEQALSQYKQSMDDAFARGDYAIPYLRSTLYFAQLILDHDSFNPAALGMKDRVRDALVQSAHSAMSRLDLAQAQDIVSALGQYFPDDEDARAAKAKLEAQIAIHRSDVRELVRKAEDALRAGNLTDPPRANAYYYSKQALTLDHQNQQAKAIKSQVRDEVLKRIEQTATAGNIVQATRELQQALKLFPEDPQLQAKQKDLEQLQAADLMANDPKERRLHGLDNYQAGKYAEAIDDLEFAVQHGRGSPEVLTALGMSYKKLRDFDNAVFYLERVPASSEDSYRSVLGALGDIEAERGSTAAAIEHYKKARDLGGSPSYPIAVLEDRIEKLEKKSGGKQVIEPTPLTIPVKHLHGGILHGSCTGTLTVDESGVRYDGNDHTFSANLVHAGVRVSKGEMAVLFQDKSEKFKPVHPGDAERFSAAVARYHSAESAPK